MKYVYEKFCLLAYRVDKAMLSVCTCICTCVFRFVVFYTHMRIEKLSLFAHGADKAMLFGRICVCIFV